MSRGNGRQFLRPYCCCKRFLVLVWAICASYMPITMAAPAYNAAGYLDAKCTDVETGRELFIGEAFTRPGQCVRVQCLGTLQIYVTQVALILFDIFRYPFRCRRCQVPTLYGNCTLVPAANEYLDYPHCCPMYACKVYASNEVGETEETRTYDQYGTLRKTHIIQVFVITDPLNGNVPGAGVKTQFEI